MALDDLLASLGPADQMRAFYEARLGRLQEYDEHPRRPADPDARRLLRRRAKPERRPPSVCSTHRNTVLYRLRRIEDLMQPRLRDPQVELELQVALRIQAALKR